jgi:hypothetical protein
MDSNRHHRQLNAQQCLRIPPHAGEIILRVEEANDGRVTLSVTNCQAEWDFDKKSGHHLLQLLGDGGMISEPAC